MEIGNNGYYNEHFRRYPKPCNGKVIRTISTLNKIACIGGTNRLRLY